ncbi:hypothetical protein [Filimonas lacunae]|uniref:hypothetical protein n=1 Tax=Filimonas lacunae TaxID=477680 RepID=UPI0007D715F4|nr:hypothetical protein [Filimonas lacunae]BAV09893.1 hypothetical protein FLA_5946 [Filimonas lacunae]
MMKVMVGRAVGRHNKSLVGAARYALKNSKLYRLLLDCNKEYGCYDKNKVQENFPVYKKAGDEKKHVEIEQSD